jgi:uncharacterized protein DUF6282
MIPNSLGIFLRRLGSEWTKTRAQTSVGWWIVAWIGLLLVGVPGNARAQEELNLKGAIDLRVHAGPDSMDRAIDADDLARLAKQSGMRALVLTNQWDSTAAEAYLVRKQVPGIEIFGSIVLDLPFGGINLEAVKRMSMMKGGWGRVVFLPEFDSENFVKTLHQSGPTVPVSKDGHLLPGVMELLDFMAQHQDLVLETGDVTAEEGLMVVHEAHVRGVKHVVVKNAMGVFVHMTVPQMKQAAGEGAYLEFVYNSVIGKKPQNPISEYAEGIKQVGPQSCVLGTDFGAVKNPPLPLHPQALLEFMQALHKEGISVADINLMVKSNPAKVLGLDP